MVLRTARNGKNAGTKFWGCSDYPTCKATRPYDEKATESKQSQSAVNNVDTKDQHYSVSTVWNSKPHLPS